MQKLDIGTFFFCSRPNFRSTASNAQNRMHPGTIHPTGNESTAKNLFRTSVIFRVLQAGGGKREATRTPCSPRACPRSPEKRQKKPARSAGYAFFKHRCLKKWWSKEICRSFSFQQPENESYFPLVSYISSLCATVVYIY